MSAQEPILTRAGQHLSLLWDAMMRLEKAGKAQSAEHDDLFQRRERIIDSAMGCQAENLRDVAVLVMMIGERANEIEGNESPADEVQQTARNIALAASAILEALSGIGIRLDDLGPIDAAYEIERWRGAHTAPGTLAREVMA